MTPAGWKALATKVAHRSVTCGAVPGLMARNVLLALLLRLAGGGEPRSQVELAAELGVDVRQVRAGIHELVALGLAWLVQDPEDARKRLPQINVAQVKAWADGSYVPVGDCEGAEDVGKYVDSFCTHSKADRCENCLHPRARGNSSSSSTTSSSAPDSSADAFNQHAAMVRAVRKALPYGGFNTVVDEAIWDWIGKYSVLHIQETCRKAGKGGGRSFAFIEKILSNDAADAAYGEEDRVVEFEQHRGSRPWNNGEAQ